MNIISKILLRIGIIGIGILILFTTFANNKDGTIEKLVFKNEKIGNFSYKKEDNNTFTMIQDIPQNPDDKPEIFIKNINHVSRILSNQETSRMNIDEKTNRININKGIHLFQINEIIPDFVIDGGLFELQSEGPGSFFVNNIDQTKTLIFSLDTIVNLRLKTAKMEVTSILLYPHSYILINQNKNLALKNADLLRVSSIFPLEFFSQKIYTKNNSNPINKDFINIITLKNNTYQEFVKNTIEFLVSETEIMDKKFPKYTQKNFMKIPGEIYIQKYFSIFVNNEKKKTYYKNIILRYLIKLFHRKDEAYGTIDIIENQIAQLAQIDTKEAESIKEIIYFYYINNLKIQNGSLMTTMNFAKLIEKVYGTNTDKINIEAKYQKQNALVFLRNIFKNYDFLQNNHFFQYISLFREQYIEIKDNRTSHQEIEYLLFFLEKLLTTDSIDRGQYINQISVLLEDYTEIATQFYTKSTDSKKKTGIFKNALILRSVENLIQNTYFRKDRNENSLLERKTQGNTTTNRKSIQRIQKSINQLNNFYQSNKQFLDPSNTNDGITITKYNTYINTFREFFEALEDYEEYKSKYNTKIRKIIGGESINSKQDMNNILNKDNIYHYLKSFRGISTQKLTLQIKNYDYCMNGEDTESDDYYCYEVQNMTVNGNNVSFILFPYESNKISNITINNIPKKGTYKLDEIEKELDEKSQNNTELQNQDAYEFKNFFTTQLGVFKQTKPQQQTTYEDESFILDESKDIKTFKRNKLLGDSGDFAQLRGFLTIQYNDLIVEEKEDYPIFIKKSLFFTNVPTCYDGNCRDKNKKYEGILESQYKFTNSHTFKNIKIQLIDTNNKITQTFLLGGDTIEIIGSVKINELKQTIDNLVKQVINLETVINAIKKNLKIKDIKIKYYTYNNRIKIETYYQEKNLTIYIKNGADIDVYYHGKKKNNNSIKTSNITNILNTIK